MKYITVTLTEEEAITIHNVVWLKSQEIISELMNPEDRKVAKMQVNSGLRKLELAINQQS